MSITVRGIEFQSNLDNPMGIEFYNLSHRFGFQCPNWPYFRDVRIERMHYMAKSGVLSQTITTTMHVTTHIDAPAHVVQGTPFIDEVPLPHFFGSGIVVSIPKKKWEPITGDDLERACGKAIRKGDVLIVNTGWHKVYEDGDYFAYCPGFVPSAADWMIEKGVKVVGHDTQANDHPLATAIGPQRNGPLLPHLADEYREWSGGHDWKDDFPEWEPVHQKIFKAGILGIENVGGDLDAVTGKRCTFAFFPINWDRGDGCIIRLGEGRGVLMLARRFADARPYDAPNHRGVVGLRLQGFEEGGPKNQWVGLSQFLPGGGAGPDSTPLEKVYVVLEGEMTVIVGGVETVLGPLDSCTIAANEVREIVNRTNRVCTMLVVIPYPEARS